MVDRMKAKRRFTVTWLQTDCPNIPIRHIQFSRSFVGNHILTIIKNIHIYNNNLVLASEIEQKGPTM